MAVSRNTVAGPAGQTLGELEDAVKDLRAAYRAKPGRDTLRKYDRAVRLLRAAQVRLKLV